MVSAKVDIYIILVIQYVNATYSSGAAKRSTTMRSITTQRSLLCYIAINTEEFQ